jgi:multidrug efflux pump subunit AcrA (membrane-fusion protein)
MAHPAFPAPPNVLEGESTLLAEKPPHWIIFAISGLIIGLFITVALIAVFVPFPEIVQCPYTLMIEGGSDPIQSPCFAIVRKVLVREGQRVSRGDELFVLSSEEARGWDTELRTLQQDLRIRQADMARDDLADASEMSIKDREAAQTEDEIKYRQTYAATIGALVARLEKLSASGAISQEELITHKLELATGQKDLSLAQKSLDQVNLQRQEMQTQHERRDADDLAEIEKIKVRLAALQEQTENTTNNLRSIRAPYDGVVVSLAERNEGSVVQDGQELCQLARPGATLRAKLVINEMGIPQLTIGERVRFFAEAFPYQRYGTLTGRLDWLSPSTVTSAQGEQFVAYASLDRDSVLVNGRAHPLQAGMRGEAHIIVGSRTLIEYAFEPLRKLREDARL